MQVEGTLFGWFETGLEGMVWALQLDNDPSYDGLFVIDDGDHLIIYSPSEEVLFNGYIVQDTEIGKTQRPFSRIMQPQAKGLWIHWTQKGYTPDDWAGLFLSEKYRAVLTKKDENT
jgi:hypothetical protein